MPVIHWLWRSFWLEESCDIIRDEMDRGAADPAEILEDTVEHQDQVRRTLSIEVSPPTLEWVERDLENARETLSGRAGMPLGVREGTGFLRYLPGGFYLPHRDKGDLPSWPGAAQRQLAVVVFLNTGRDAGASDGFTGGVLRLYPEDGDPIDILPQAGLLVAFPATTLHEVTRVGDAVRDVVVDWFY